MGSAGAEENSVRIYGVEYVSCVKIDNLYVDMNNVGTLYISVEDIHYEIRLVDGELKIKMVKPVDLGVIKVMK